VYHGLVALNYLHNTALSDSSHGDGVALLVDAGTVARLIDRP
jgi:hypothetical protein